MNQTERMKELVELLNKAGRAYYQEDREIISNYEYDKLYDELEALEEETGITLAGSPTVSVGYEAAPRPPRTFALMRSPADCVVGGGVPDAPRRGQDPSLRCKGYGVVMARLRAGHARPLQTAVNGSRTRGAREGGSPAPFRVRRLPGNGRPRTARRNPPVR